MGRVFDIPVFYRSPIISRMKALRRLYDHRKKDLSPSVLKLGPLTFKIARHFGFCFGVENAIEIAFKALAENGDRRVFLLSEMIHNPQVNQDLEQRGVRFLLTPAGEMITPFEDLTPDDIVIVPAFGTTVELFEKLRSMGIDPTLYNATCPFVEKVWKRAEQLGSRGFTVIIHGKHYHEETKATFSHANLAAPSLVIRDLREAQVVADFILGSVPEVEFLEQFKGRYSDNFAPSKDLLKIGVVNQTTMLAHETHAISDLLRKAIEARFGLEEGLVRFGDTRDTLCYATSENQQATHGLIASGGDFAVVVGGYNSSNTANLSELLEKNYPTYYIKDATEIISSTQIRHLDRTRKIEISSDNWVPALNTDSTLEVLITAGASCPDALVDQVLERIASFFPAAIPLAQAVERYTDELSKLAELSRDDSGVAEPISTEH